MRTNWLAPTASILILASGIILWESYQLPDAVTPPTKTKKHIKQGIATGVKVREYNTEGVLSTDMTSDKVIQYQWHPHKQTPKDYATLAQPRTKMYRQDAPPWTISANKGVIKNMGDKVTLTGAVDIIQPYADSDQVSRLKTEQLDIKPKLQFASTHKAVTIEDASGITQAIGMKADMSKEIIILQKQVSSVFTPEK